MTPPDAPQPLTDIALANLIDDIRESRGMDGLNGLKGVLIHALTELLGHRLERRASERSARGGAAAGEAQAWWDGLPNVDRLAHRATTPQRRMHPSDHEWETAEHWAKFGYAARAAAPAGLSAEEVAK